MNLVKEIKIENVRSIQNQEIKDIGSLHVLVGKNSSGKSNTLRALNLFFNGHIEPGRELDFQADHYEQIPKQKKKKKIAISIVFSLPKNFKFRQGIDHIEPILTNEFTISRIWELNQQRRPVDRYEVVVNGKEIKNGDEIARQFLSLITYRYIPNRTVPSEILKEESQDIANLIFGRMKGDKHSAALLKSLGETAERILENASNSMVRTGAPLSRPSIATADTIGEMLVMSGFQARGAHGLLVKDEDWGAGHQAFFLYQVLCALDTSYSRFFGWKQATIWGVEEPEAGLHKDLETRLASQFREWCEDYGLRLQLFTTTHSSIFTMAAESGSWVELQSGESVYIPQNIQDLTYSSETKGVTEWVHPVLYFPWNPVVLVEGKYDVDALTHVSKLIGNDIIKYVSVPDIDPSEKRGGDKKIISFLSRNKKMIKNRQMSAPLIVMLDWDVSDTDLNKARSAYGDGGKRFVLRMNVESSNPRLSNDFKGIEKYFPEKVFLKAHDNEDVVVGISATKPLSISQSQLNGGKRIFCDLVKEIEDINELEYLITLTEQVNALLSMNNEQQSLF